MAEQIIKKEDKLHYLGGFMNKKKGSLVLTRTHLSFVTKKETVFDIALSDIISVNPKRGIGNGVDFLYVLYTKNGEEKQVKIQHLAYFVSLQSSIAARINTYFAPWEQIINDARFGKIT